MVNILLSTYNGARYIEEQLESIRTQTYSNYHVYIRDDGSTDETVEVIHQFIKKYAMEEKITLTQGENVGFCKSFFLLLNQAKTGNYWAFCDQDDVWYPDKLKLAVDWMQGKEEQDIPLLYLSAFELANEDLSEREVYKTKNFAYRFENSITSNLFFGFATMINRRLYERLILANPEMIKYHDWFSAMIVAAFGYYHISHHISAVHRQHEDNSSPLVFLKKIPHGIRLLKGDCFYTKQAQEFMRLFGQELTPEQREVLGWFTNQKYSFTTACKKAFYPHRWNPQLPVELVLRVLMLVGKI